MFRGALLCALAALLLLLGRVGDSQAAIMTGSLSAPSYAGVNEPVRFVFSYRMYGIPYGRYDFIRSYARLSFGDGSWMPLYINPYSPSGTRHYYNRYAGAGDYTATTSGWFDFIDRRRVPMYRRYCSYFFGRSYCYNRFVGYRYHYVTVGRAYMPRLSATTSIGELQEPTNWPDVPGTADATLPEPASFALLAVGLAGVGFGVRRQRRR